jgi:hypothetical protein
MSVFRASNAADTNNWTIPQPRGPYPIGEPYDGPTERLYDAAIDDSEIDDEQPPPEPRPARRGLVVCAVTLAAIALIASGAAGLVAWRALAVADTAAQPHVTPSPAAGAGVTAAASAGPSPSVDPDPSAAATEAAASDAAASEPAAGGPSASADPLPPRLDPSARYPVSYAQEQLTVPVGCSSVTYVDLDEPTAEAEEKPADLRYDSRCGQDPSTLTLGAGARAGAQVTGSDTGAAGCDDAIRTSPLDRAAAVPVKRGTVLCVLTSAADATARGAEAQLVLVEITGVTEQGSVSMRATSWAVP